MKNSSPASNTPSVACSGGSCHGEVKGSHNHHTCDCPDNQSRGKACGCGHDHSGDSSSHKNHIEDCGCEHKHHEEERHQDGCGCGHDHSHTENSPKWPLAAALGLFVLGFLPQLFPAIPSLVAALLFALSALIAGRRVFLSGLRNLIRLKFNENVLMSIAIITAFCLGEFSEASLVAILFCIGELAEGAAERNARKSIRALTEIRPDTARLLTPQGEQQVAAQGVQVGDVVAVNPFERIPVDGVITQGSSYIDNAALTGESLPVPVSEGDSLLSGGVNGSSRLLVRATAAFADSTSSRILKLIEESGARKGSTEKLITRFARIYTPIVIALAVIITFLPPLLGWGPLTVWLGRALVMLVASCPCALVISVPLGFFAGIGAQSKIGVLIKGGKFLEALAKADAIAFDKTGTITTSALKISSISSAGPYSQQEILAFAASAEALSTHPLAKAICGQAGQVPEAQDISEQPGQGITALLEGRSLAVGRKQFLLDQGIDVPQGEDATVYVAVGGSYVGAILLSDTVKEDSPQAIAQLKAMGIPRIVMLTGDNPQAAKEVSQLCGIPEYHAGLLPADKARLVEEMSGSHVLFVGDGVNDAPVLAAADCGIAMGLGSQAAIETADTVLTAGRLSVLPRAIALAKKTMGIIRFNIVFSLAFKAVVLVLAAIGWAPMWFGIVSDVGVMLITVLNATRLIRTGKA